MNLNDIIQRNNLPKAWEEGQTIPWNEPEFSQRILFVITAKKNS